MCWKAPSGTSGFPILPCFSSPPLKGAELSPHRPSTRPWLCPFFAQRCRYRRKPCCPPTKQSEGAKGPFAPQNRSNRSPICGRVCRVMIQQHTLKWLASVCRGAKGNQKEHHHFWVHAAICTRGYWTSSFGTCFSFCQGKSGAGDPFQKQPQSMAPTPRFSWRKQA